MKNNIQVVIFFLQILQLIIQQYINLMISLVCKMFIIQILTVSTAQVIASVDFSQNVVRTGSYAVGNMIGMAMNYEQMLPLFRNNLLTNYLLNSNIYGDWSCNFNINIHMPINYFYNCSILSNTLNNTNCTYEMEGKNSTTRNIADFIFNSTNKFGLSLGWNMQGSNFSDSAYIKKFKKWYLDIYMLAKHQQFNVELGDMSDNFTAMRVKQNYTVTDFIVDASFIQVVLYGLVIVGPGITENADKSWYDAIHIISSKHLGYFSVRCLVFPNASLATIQNLLSDNYTKGYLQRRFTINGTVYYTSFQNQYIGISDIRLVSNSAGINGITNSFAAGIWAIDMIMEWAIMGGIRIDFYNPMSFATNQTIMGQAPLFNPTPMYTALLFAIMANQGNPGIELPNVVSGLSSNIKVYGLSYYSSYGVLILNKDTNISLNGTVDVFLQYNQGLNCIYLQAPNLNSTSGIKFGKVQFVGNNSFYVGDWKSQKYYINSQGYYSINVAYAQVVYCRIIQTSVSFNFPKGRSKNYQASVKVMWLLLLFVILMLI